MPHWNKKRSGLASIEHVISKRNLPRLNDPSLLDYYLPYNDFFFQSNANATVSSRPNNFDLETRVVTDLSILEQHKIIANTLDNGIAFNNMRIYYSHLLNSVNNIFQKSLSMDPDLRINIKIVHFLFAEIPNHSLWALNSIVGMNVKSPYNGKETLNSKYALDSFKVYLNNLNFPFTYDIAVGFIK